MHISKATPRVEEQHLQQKVLPVAILLGTGKFTVQSALAALEEEPMVRNLIAANTGIGTRGSAAGEGGIGEAYLKESKG